LKYISGYVIIEARAGVRFIPVRGYLLFNRFSWFWSIYSLGFMAYSLPLGFLSHLLLFIFAYIFITVPAEAVSAESTVLVAA
jgi:hypothetical protein